MPSEISMVVDAIESLKPAPNYFKDYIFPIASALFTSVLGAGIAYFTLRHQESLSIEKQKMDTANKWTLQVEEARSTLIAIKGNYYDKLTSDPFQRVSAIPSILFHAEAISENYQELSFIVPSKKDRKTDKHKWSQIPRIRSMISNYNYLLKLWLQRNEQNESFKQQLFAHFRGQAIITITPDSAIAAAGSANMVALIDLNERVIKLTDDLIEELDCFLEEFPNFVKTKIKVNRLRKYGSVLTYSNNDNKILLELIKKTPAVDFTSAENLFGEKSEDIQNRHKTGYE